MKIGILTQPLHNNYGGLFQCYALQTILKRMGHDAIVLQRTWGNPPLLVNLYNEARGFLHWLRKVRKKGYPYTMAKKVEIHTRAFAKKYIFPRSTLLYSTKSLTKASIGIDTFVVGSDQVWRPMYSPCIENYFLDFAQRRNVRRIAYAASFGIDEWEFTDEQTALCAPLARMFDAISVREDSAVGLCSKYLGVDATHVLDPTLLLARENYEALAIAEGETPSSGNLFCYVLDDGIETQELVRQIAERTSFTPFYCMPLRKYSINEHCGEISDYVYPSPTRWLRSFMDAEMVFTDSFHGCIFSIIFNKPFWVIGNKKRGMARFCSLLSMFDLEQRIVTPETFCMIDVLAPIDWEKVRNRHEEWRDKSIRFLMESLG